VQNRHAGQQIWPSLVDAQWFPIFLHLVAKQQYFLNQRINSWLHFFNQRINSWLAAEKRAKRKVSSQRDYHDLNLEQSEARDKRSSSPAVQ
jgi:hypothetical protein